MSDKQGVNTLVLAAARYGVRHVVIAPGSRNAPIVIAFHRSGLFHCHSIPDERVAAFYALGISLATGLPAAVVCTSGSASINFAPAISEAFYLRAPLIAITADRPQSFTDQGMGQTIRQENLYHNFIRGWCNLIAEPRSYDDHWYNRRKLSELFNVALHADPGPVHFNVPLSEPLYGAAPASDLWPRLHTRTTPGPVAPDDALLQSCAKSLSVAKRVMILVGQMLPNEAPKPVLERWAALPNVVVLGETTSNVEGPGILATIDRLIVSVYDEEELEGLMPDVLITIGGAIVSKKIKALLRKFAPQEHWHVHPYDRALDTFQALTLEVASQPGPWLESLAEKAEGIMCESDYAARWAHLNYTRGVRHHTYVASMPWSDFKAFEQVLGAIPDGAVVHMANSSPVRYVQLFGNSPHHTYHSNRGTSGIDGCTSTAIGWALARPQDQVVLLTGDMAFVYDSNALWNRELPQNVKVVVINNQGGGIFRIIDGPDKSPELEDFFEAYHPARIERIAQTFDLPYFRAGSEGELLGLLKRFFAMPGCAVLEIVTPRYENAAVLKGYFQALRD
jgi:2-succinyl-5-enolpyruvyl-6-hydroxy-3-cyclohexene-1-carboxylate synthase